MTYVFDLDGTLCTDTGGKYEDAQPLVDRILRVRGLVREGHRVMIDTARGSAGDAHRKLYLQRLTVAQLREWGCPYHVLRVGEKPPASVYVDDRAKRPGEPW